MLTIIRKQKLRDHELRCLVLGLDNAGKSTLVQKLLPEEQRMAGQVLPTRGFRIETLELYDHHVSIWDVGGQRSLRPFWDNYFERTDVLVWCVDASVPLRFEESVQELVKLRQQDVERMAECRVIVVLTKSDLVKDVRDVKEKLRELLGEVKFLAASSITGEGVEQLGKYITGI